MQIKFIENFGAGIIRKTESIGRLVIFFAIGVMHIFIRPFQINKILDQIVFIGSKSVFVIALTGFFTGMVLGLQGYYSLIKFGSEAALGSAVALTLIRELGPVLTAIMVTARAGSAMAAEIGVMRISEQIDALRTMHINPVRFLFTPRIVASVFSFPLLTALFNVVGIFGGYITGAVILDLSSNIYMDGVIESVSIDDILDGFYKAFAFSVVVTTISCYRGFYMHMSGEFGARGVSTSTTNAVVQSCIFILIVDYLITYFLV